MTWRVICGCPYHSAARAGVDIQRRDDRTVIRHPHLRRRRRRRLLVVVVVQGIRLGVAARAGFESKT